MTVTFLFTDIEGSTELWEKHPRSMQIALARHDNLLENAIEKNNGRVFKNLGDGHCAVFHSAYSAVQASLDIQRAISSETWHETQIKVRTALHAGDPEERDGDYFGPPVNRVARLLSAGHGGQILISKAVEQLILDQLSGGVELLDLGKHRLKNLTLPERIFQVKAPFLQIDFPPLRTRDSSLNNLPVQSTPFVGREEELATLEEMLIDPDIRLITIVGPGGIGKTRLALALAERQLSNFEHGVFFVSLASLDAAEDIVSTVSRGLGFSFYEDVDHRRQLIDYLRAKSMLLLLDNFEHLLEGASLASEIVQAAAGVRVIVTSREPLRLLDEQLFSVQGLDFPEWETPEDALEYDAARLFLSSARRSRSEFDLGQGDLQPMTRICRLVQGMPLGIVLAAGWVELLSPAEIAEELGQGIDILRTDLRDVPERQRSMQIVFESTWKLLDQKERDVLKRLSVFRGGSSHKAIQQVTGATLMELKSLAGKSLLNTDHCDRHDLHELLRQYAAEKLEADPEAIFEAHDRHCAYYLDAIAELEDDLYGPQVKRVMAEIDGDLENVRSALRWAAANQRVDRLDRAINPLFQYYYWRDLHHSLFKDAQIIVEGLKRADSPEARLITARVLARQGWFLPDQEDLELLTKSEALLHRNEVAALDTRKDEAFILMRLGGLIVYSDPQRGLEMSKESLGLFRELGDLWGEAATLNNLALHADVTDNLEEEKRIREESRIIYEQMGNPQGIAESLYQLSRLAADRGDVEEAQHLARQSYKTLGDVGYPSSVARSSYRLGSTMYWIGLFDDALELFKDARRIYEDLGNERFNMWCNYMIAWTYSCMGEYESASSLAWQCLSYFEPIGEVGETNLLLAILAVIRKDPGEARRQAQKGLEISRAHHEWRGELWCPLLIGLAERQHGNESVFRHQLIEGLRIATRRKELGFTGAGLAPAALFFADRGEVERAVEIYELACQHPFVANAQHTEDLYGKHIASAAQILPPEVVTAARQRGRERDPWETAKEILAELEAEEAQD